MTELASHWADTAEPLDYGLMIDHLQIVRYDRTAVKLDHVQVYAQYRRMMAEYENTLGNKMRALKERSRMSLGEIAKALEKPRSSIQRFFEEGYKPGGMLSLEEAIMFIGVLVGKGLPPIRADEILALTALSSLSLETELPAPGLENFPPEVAKVIARSFARVLQPGQEPPADRVEALSEMISELTELYRRDPAMRLDAARTSGALELLRMQLSRPSRELQ